MGLSLIKLRNDARGAALVEFTLVAPLLISLMCGLAEFSLAFRQYHIMQKSVRDAGRYLSRYDGVICPSADGGWSAVVTDAETIMVYGELGGTTPLLRGWDSTPPTMTVSETCVANAPDAGTGTRAWRGGDYVATVSVSMSAPFQGLGLLSVLGLEEPTLQVAHEQLVIGG